MISANFLNLFIACLEAMDPISLMFVLTAMFAVLKGFEMVSSTAMTLNSSWLLRSLTCFGATDIYFVFKSY